jgi:hypothetical protein
VTGLVEAKIACDLYAALERPVADDDLGKPASDPKSPAAAPGLNP